MQVILLENIKNLGKIGDIIKVKSGYGRNFLIKFEKALSASKENIKIVNNKKEQLNEKDLVFKKEAKKNFEILNKKNYKIQKLVTENNDLYGSVKPTEIAKIIKEKHNVDIKPLQIDLEKEIKSVGIFRATINLHSEIQANILIEVEKSEEIKT
jgi:large subunit ribosomal protein L9|tara:strand:+ start:3818 stop:4279 length:462 start_codon:yes stop_codon:yes gene_type:complete